MATLLVSAGLSAGFAAAAQSVAISAGLGLVRSALTPAQQISQEGTRLDSSKITSSTEGAYMSRVEGRARLGGTIIWATKFKEEINTTETTSGGKGSGPKVINTTTEYLYSSSFAVGLCESDSRVRLLSVYADGKILDLSTITYRFYTGEGEQLPDPKIEATEGNGTTPAFRGLCYIVFEDMPLTEYGNRFPQISVELVKPIEDTQSGAPRLEDTLRAVQVIPASGEAIYATEPFTYDLGEGNTRTANIHNQFGEADIVKSFDDLSETCRLMNSASLVVSWFGTSLDATECRVVPKTEATTNVLAPDDWRVSTATRANGETVSYIDSKNVTWTVDGTISNLEISITDGITVETIVAGIDYTVGVSADGDGQALADAISILRSRRVSNIKVDATYDTDNNTVTLFDYTEQGTMSVTAVVEDANVNSGSLTNFSGELGSPVFGGTPSDISVRQAVQDIKSRGWRAMFYPFLLMDTTGYPWRGRITGDPSSFLGTAAPADFGTWDDTSKILAYTGPDEWTHRRMILHYAALMKDIMVAGDAFVIGSEMRGLTTAGTAWGTALATLISDVKSIMPAGVLVSYAADWSEYQETSLAPVWNTADFIGIDNYLPITDWRDGDEDYSIEHFKAGIEGGEYYDYYYADDAARLSNTRLPITDPQYRTKDIRYWVQTNYSGTPVWFTEYGAPAVNKGANQPNVFVDKKSTESFLPYFSNGERNDYVQRLYYEAIIDYWTEQDVPEISVENMFAWTWDARPYPAFPGRTDVWSDGPNWQTGHWLNGRLDAIPLPDLVYKLCLQAGIPPANIDVSRLFQLHTLVRGMHVDSLSSTRTILENLMQTYSFDAYEDGKTIRFVTRLKPETTYISFDDFVLDDDAQSYQKTREQDNELPDRTKVSFVDEYRDYSASAVDGHTVTGYSNSVTQFSTICILDSGYARALADILTQSTWVARDTLKFSVPINYVTLKPGELFSFSDAVVSKDYRIEKITMGDKIEIEATVHVNRVFDPVRHAGTTITPSEVAVYGRTKLLFAEIPVENAAAPNQWSPRIIAYQNPWPGAVNIFEENGESSFTLNTQHVVSNVIGELTADLGSAPYAHIWDDANTVSLRLYDTSQYLISRTDLDILNGANSLAVLTPSGEWEILQYVTAVPTGTGLFDLTRLLRGQLGTEHYMGSPSLAGATVFVVDENTQGFLNGSQARFRVPKPMLYGPNGVANNDARYQEITVTPAGVIYRPYSPTHLHQTRDAVTGDIELDWIRRTRFNGDSWDVTEIPLNEDSETYKIDIYDNGTVVRSETVENATTYTYTAANQTADFGAVQTTIHWTIQQISALYGAGTPRESLP